MAQASKVVRNHKLRGDAMTIKTPPGSTILSHDINGGVIDLWILSPHVETELVERRFALAKTDEEIVIEEPYDIIFIATFQLKDQTVLHLFEIIEKQ